MKITIPDGIKDWAFWLSSRILGDEKLPLCPWAYKSIIEESVDFWIDEDPGTLIPLPEKIKVRIVQFSDKSFEEIINIKTRCNLLDPNYIFLESHPDDSETIGGLKSVYKDPLILIQNRKDLEDFRKILSKTNYYSYWDKNSLDDLLQT